MLPQSDGRYPARRLQGAAGLGLVVMLWATALAFDVLTGPRLTGLFLFLVAVIAAAWFLGAWAGVVASVASTAAAVSIAHEWPRGLPGSMQADVNTLKLLATFVLCAWLSDRTREAQSRVCAEDPEIGVSRPRGMVHAGMRGDELSIREAEQRRIGRDLHDGLSQHLTATMLAARLLEEKLAAQSAPEAGEVGQITRLIEDAIGQVQHLSRGLYPAELAGVGLAGALEQLATNTQRLSGIRCSWDWASSEEPSQEAVAIHLYRIAQEAVGNALRHASPASIVIRLSVRGDTLSLDVVDDGIGLQPGALRSGGLGMRTMRDHARVIGGVLEVVPRAPRGTRVTCAIPGAARRRASGGSRPGPGGQDGSETTA